MSNDLLSQLLQDALVTLPFLCWVISACLVLTAQILFRDVKLTAFVGVVTSLASLAYAIMSFQSGNMTTAFHGCVSFDGLSQFFNILTGIVVLAVLAISLPALGEASESFKKSSLQFPEYIVCLQLSAFGVAVTASAVDLTVLFLGLETISFALYGLCGFYRQDLRSTESALKYLLTGAFSTAILLYAIALFYGATGSTNYDEILRTIQAGDVALVSLACVFFVAAMAVKLALVPFHLYTPDVYEGAPTPVTAYLSTIVKVGAVAASMRVFWGFLGADPIQPYWMIPLTVLSVLSIVIGNLSAIYQTNLKKLFAFSSISHAGFIGLGLVVATPLFVNGQIDNETRAPLLAYLTVYCAMGIGTFAVISYLEDHEKSFMVSDLRGLAQRRFFPALLLALFSIGLAGLPPFAGFIIKFWLLQELIVQGYLWVSLLAILGAVIGAAYYLKILMLMFMSKEGDHGAAVSWPGIQDRFYSLRLVVIAAALLTVVGGLWPSSYANWIFASLGLK